MVEGNLSETIAAIINGEIDLPDRVSNRLLAGLSVNNARNIQKLIGVQESHNTRLDNLEEINRLRKERDSTVSSRMKWALDKLVVPVITAVVIAGLMYAIYGTP